MVAAKAGDKHPAHRNKCGSPAFEVEDNSRKNRMTPMLASAICFIGGLFALIALMPPFDGREGGDWGRQEGDEAD